MKNSVVHFEIYADQPDKLAEFYTTLFDWELEAMPAQDYTVVQTVETNDQHMPTRPGAINGGLLKRPDGYGVKAWVSYVSVDSVDASVAKAQQLGAKLTKPKAAVPGMGWFAMLVDPQGNNFAIWQSDKNAK
jgi:predicted enzyme related to lactoylglutathione lyase